MALPTINFNSSTGSDTQASGSGNTAIFGTGASTAASTVVTLLVDNPDLSAVPTDGSGVIWIGSSSGRQFAKITAVNNTAGVKTVTVANAFANTESSKNWAIGGKRATLDNATSRLLLTTSTGALPGWTLQFEDDASCTISSAIVGATSGDSTAPIIIRGSAAGRIMNQTASANHFSSTGGANPTSWLFENLKFTNSNGTKTNAIALNMSGGQFQANNCIFGDATNTLNTGVNRAANTPTFYGINCDFISCTVNGINYGASGNIFLNGCRVKSCGTDGVRASGTTIVLNSLFYSNGADGLIIPGTGTSLVVIQNNTFNGNTGDGLDFSSGILSFVYVLNNNFTTNGNYGIRGISTQNPAYQFFDYNNFGTGGLVNTSGSMLNITAGAHDLAVDPGYVNAAGGNFAVGTAVKALGFPLASVGTIGAGQSATNSYVDVGAAQRQEAGSGMLLHSGMTGGIRG